MPQIFSRVSDPLNGYYLLRREAIEGIELQPTGFKTLIEVLACGRVKTGECGYAMEKRRCGQSNASGIGWRIYYNSSASARVLERSNLGTLHTPISHYLFVPAAAIHDPTTAILAGSLLACVIVFSALGFALVRSARRSADVGSSQR